MAQRAPIEALKPNRIPPHNLDAEQSVLGAMLESKEAIANVLEILRAEDFYKPAHTEIYETILALYARGEAADAITVADELGRRGTLQQIGGKPYIHGLLEAYPTASSAAHYARIVEEHSLLRNLVDAGNKVQEIGFAMPEDVSDAIDEAEEIIYEVGNQRLGRNDYHALRDLLVKSWVDIEKLYERGESITGVASGFPDLDELTSGFQASNLIIVAARPGQGKSSLLNDFALQAATKHGTPVVFFTLEMSKDEVVKRFLASEARVDARRIGKGSLQEQDWARLSAASGRLAEAPIFIDDTASITLMEMRAKCRRLKARQGLGLIIIDYLQLMQSPRRSENRQQEVSDISRSLKILAKELEVPVICASQLNRAVEARADKRPLLGDLRESGCLTGDTRILRADTNELVTMRELYERGERNFLVWSMDDNQMLVRRTMTHVFATGIKTVYKLRTRSGREIKASGNHPFMTLDGWKRLDELVVGAPIAAPRLVRGPTEETDWPDDHIVLLAHLIGDGSVLRNLPVRYASLSQDNLAAVSNAAEAFGITARCHFEVAARSFQMFLPAPFRLARGRRNPIVAWMDSLGLYDKRSHQKFVPAQVFGLPDEQVALFLRHLWATDGYIGRRRCGSKRYPSVYYSTSSRRLAEDVAALLLRFGIFVRIGTTKKGDYRPNYHVHIRGRDQLDRFVILIGAFGPKIPGFVDVVDFLCNHPPRSRTVGIRSESWQKVRSVGTASSSMTTLLAPAVEDAERLAGGLRELFDYRDVLLFSETDVSWDEVTKIERLGPEPVFDATVLGTHNFVADGLVAKNSIEQDSDLVMFIYRDELYNPDSPARGEAEILIAKHRNGPTGLVRLAFMSQYTKFASLAKGPKF